MSIQRAEQLKREWTDRYVTVLDGVPELRRFQGLIGQVKTVNMNCRLLIEFDCPADISWYDVDPQFVTVVDPAQQPETETESAAATTASAPATPSADPSNADKPTADKPGPAATGGMNPLDAIRASAGGATADSGTTPPAAKPAVNPLDAIRAGGSGGKAATSPLDQIRSSAAASPADTTAAKGQPTGPGESQAPTASPLDQIRNSGKAVPNTDTPPAAAAANPLDQIRAQAAQSTEPAAPPADNSSPPSADTTSDETETEAEKEKEAVCASASDTAADADPTEATESETPAADAPERATAEIAAVAPAVSPPPVGSSTTDAGATESALQQVHAQASEGNASAPPQSRFAQVSQQAATPPVDRPSASAESVTSSADSTDLTATTSAAKPEPEPVPELETEPKTEPEAAVADTDDAETAGHTSPAGAGQWNATPSGGGTVSPATGGRSQLKPRRKAVSSKARTSSIQQRTPQNRRHGASPRNSRRGPLTARFMSTPRPHASAMADDVTTGVEDPVRQTFHGRKLPQQDDLKIIEGIGPKIAEQLQAAGITTWAELATASVAQLQEILAAAGPRFRMHQPDTWPQQASLASAGRWSELETLQDQLDGGKPPE